MSEEKIRRKENVVVMSKDGKKKMNYEIEVEYSKNSMEILSKKRTSKK